VGICAVVLAAAGLITTSLARILKVEKGFAAEGAVALDVTLPPVAYADTGRRIAFYEETLAALSSQPGVLAAGVTTQVPVEGDTQVDMLGRENDERPVTERPHADVVSASPGYFRAMGLILRKGRTITPSDRGRAVVVLSERAAEALWPGEDAIGRRMTPGSNDPTSEVIGVVADVRTAGLEREGNLIAYVPYWQRPPFSASLVVQAGGDEGAALAAARKAIHSVSAAVPVTRARTMPQVVDAAVASRRFQVLILGVFAFSALLTACIGIYGIVAQAVTRRRNEIGVRLAIGATPSDVERMVLGQGIAPAVIGLLAGIAVSIALGRVFGSLLFGVEPSDPATLLMVAAVLLCVVAMACWTPARRAARTDAMQALRTE
jgi:putative ABC transport system permease protein